MLQMKYKWCTFEQSEFPIDITVEGIIIYESDEHTVNV